MKKFFLSLGENDIYKTLMKEPLTYVAGAALLAIFQIAHFAALDSAWGVTGPFTDWGAWMLQAVGLDITSWQYFSTEAERKILANGFLKHGGSLRNLGVIVGALLATLYASQFKIKKIKSMRQVAAAILGGLMMGYGARIAGGCNIGNLFSGTSAMALSGWIFALFLVIGAYFGGKLLTKYFI